MSDERKFLGIELPKAPDQWLPVRTLGFDKLTDAEKLIADSLSVMEQKATYSIQVATSALSIVVLLAKIVGAILVIGIALEGPRILKTGLELVGVKANPAQTTK